MFLQIILKIVHALKNPYERGSCILEMIAYTVVLGKNGIIDSSMVHR